MVSELQLILVKMCCETVKFRNFACTPSPVMICMVFELTVCHSEVKLMLASLFSPVY